MSYFLKKSFLEIIFTSLREKEEEEGERKEERDEEEEKGEEEEWKYKEHCVPLMGNPFFPEP